MTTPTSHDHDHHISPNQTPNLPTSDLPPPQSSTPQKRRSYDFSFKNPLMASTTPTPTTAPPKPKYATKPFKSGYLISPSPCPSPKPRGEPPTYRNLVVGEIDDERLHLHLHQSVLLNLSPNAGIPGSETLESDLWILPDIEEWEVDSENTLPMPCPTAPAAAKRDNPTTTATRKDSLLQRAVESNRERLRRRLEGDGWDFVGGRYGDDGGSGVLLSVENGWSAGGEKVDEEFDVVVLGVPGPTASPLMAPLALGVVGVVS